MKQSLALAVIGLALCAASVARADDARVEARLDTELARYGSSHETVYQVLVAPSARVAVTERWTVFGVMPLSGGHTVNNACCRYSLGNATVGGELAGARDAFDWWVSSSVSLPTAATQGEMGLNSRTSATTQLTRDAGYYLPDTTTVRADAGGEVPVGERVTLRARVGVHYWSTASMAIVPNTFVIPTAIEGAYEATTSLSVRAAFTTNYNTSAEVERWIHGAELGVDYRRGSYVFGGTVHVPLDESFRDLTMFSVAATVRKSY
jgi:hypothetical protein